MLTLIKYTAIHVLTFALQTAFDVNVTNKSELYPELNRVLFQGCGFYTSAWANILSIWKLLQKKKKQQDRTNPVYYICYETIRKQHR